MYQMLEKNKERHLLEPKYWDIIRYHSLYPWHSNGYYRNLMDDDDYVTLENCQKFQKCDLYTKQSANTWKPRPSFLKECDTLIEKYFPEPFDF